MYNKHRNSGARRRFSTAIPLLLCCCLLSTVAPPTPTGVWRHQSVAGAPLEPRVSQVLANVAQSLGWPTAVGAYATVHGQALGVSSTGTLPADVSATIVAVRGEGQSLLDALQDRAMTSGVFHGWPAIIVHPDDPAPTSGDRHTVDHGLVAWHCGAYAFLAEDREGGGREDSISEALHAVAERHGLCGVGSTVVVLAETADTSGSTPLGHYEALAREVNRYYAHNAYGRVALDFRFMDADGPKGDDDWHSVGPELSTYAEDPMGFALAATQRAFEGARLTGVIYLERAIVVYPAARSEGASQVFSPVTIWLPSEHRITIGSAGHTSTLSVASLVLLPEESRLGIWAHEIGHTLHSKYALGDGYHRLRDRYHGDPSRRWYAQVRSWGLMGFGDLRGNPAGASPTHMCSYTKEAANWLHYVEAQTDRDYHLTALEHQGIGDAILRIDDPLSTDPLNYYIIEARDREALYGAPQTGVMVYHVTYDRQEERAEVHAIISSREIAAADGRLWAEYPTLYGVALSDGVKEYTIEGAGLRLTLLSESFSPYQATVRVERHAVVR